ncbi:MAG: type VI secretion system baseplate subunit TssK, partial [Deltaproteobacteria bacterium]|nr:type VI secretion system baseplate subunit TssK [Deltaproteobacteria bacterium]
VDLEAVMPDGLVVAYGGDQGEDLELDLVPYLEEMKQKPLTVHIVVPAKKRGIGATKGDLLRYDSVQGRPVVDENTGESELSIPRLRPRLGLLLTETPPQKYSAFPLAKVAYQNETFVLTDYVAPTLAVSIRSPIGEMCNAIAHRMREKAVSLSERVRSPSSVMRGPMLLTTKSMIRSLVSGLPQFESILNTGMAHPYTLYLSLCTLVGHVASLGRSLIPPVLAPYDHNELFGAFEQARVYIFRMIDEGILETHTPVLFDFEAGMFSLKLEAPWMTPHLLIGVRGRHGASEKDVLGWMEESLIGSSDRMESMKDKRILGASRHRIEGDEELIPVTGVILFSVKTDPEFIHPDEMLQVFNTSDPAGKRSPAEIVLYVRNEPQ